MWPFKKKEAERAFSDAEVIDPVAAPEPEISQPVAAILQAMEDRPDDFSFTDDRMPVLEAINAAMSIYDNATNVEIDVYRRFDCGYMGFRYSALQKWISGHEAKTLLYAANKISKLNTDKATEIERARICALYNVTPPQTPDN